MSARVIEIRPGVRRNASATEAAEFFRQRAESLRAEADECDRNAELCLGLRRPENSPCPPPRATEETGSPTCNEGDPTCA